MAVKETYINQQLIDYSNIAPIVNSDLNIAMCIDSQTGPMDATLVRSKSELIDLYFTNNELMKTDPITVKSAAKILQFAPIYVTRAIDSNVLPGMTSSGKVCFSDKDFNIYKRSYKIELEEKIDNNNRDNYLLFKKSINKQDGTKDYEYILFYSNTNQATETALKGKYTINKEFPIELNAESKTPFIDLALEVNKNTDNINYLADIKLENGYINIITSPEVVLVDYPKNVTKFTSKNLASDTNLILDRSTEGEYFMTQNNYISLNGSTYYNAGMTPTNYTYPGEAKDIKAFKGNLDMADPANKDKFDLIEYGRFLIYLNEELVKSNAILPTAFDSILTINFGDSSIKSIKFIGEDKELIEDYVVIDNEKHILKILPNTIKLNSLGIELVITNNNQEKEETTSILVYTGNVNVTNSKLSYKTDIVTLHMLALRMYEWTNINYIQSGDKYKSTNINNILNVINGIRKLTNNSTWNGFSSTYETSDLSVIYFNDSDIVEFSVNYDDPTNSEDFNHISKADMMIPSEYKKITEYIISGDKLNNNEVLYSNIALKIFKGPYALDGEELIEKDSDSPYSGWTNPYNINYISKKVFYIGNYSSNDPDEELYKISSAPMTYSQFLSSVRRIVNKIYDITYTPNGFTLFDYDDHEVYDIYCSVQGSGDSIEIMEAEDSNRYTDYSNIFINDAFAVINKFPSKSSVTSFSYNIDKEDREMIDLSISYKLNPTEYSVSLVEDKVDGDGISAYIEKVNELNKYVNIVVLNKEAKLLDSFNSRLFGNEVPVVTPEADDFAEGFEKFRIDNGVYYDFIFDGGETSPVIAKTISELAKDLWALSLITLKDTPDYAQVIDYRNNLGIDDCRSYTAAPLLVDTTIGSFVTHISPCIGFLERIYSNKGNGKEYAPVFGRTNGICNYTPKYKFNDKEKQREPMLNSQVNTVVWSDVDQFATFNLELTLQKADTTLSDASCVRMINSAAHICDNILKDFIGLYNDESTRQLVTSRISEAIYSRLYTNQSFSPDDFKVICNTSNNTNSIISQRQLVVDVLYKLRNGIRYINVYHKVYNMTQDFPA